MEATRLRLDMENEMAEIVVTQAAVRKLAAILSNTDTTKIRHGDRLDLIASAFGWRGDAFMHALKTASRGPRAVTIPTIEPSPFNDQPWERAVPLRKIGIRLCFMWELAAERTHGVLICTGATGSGRTTTITSTAHYLARQGRVMRPEANEMLLKHGNRGDVVVFGAINDRESAKLAYGLAKKGMLVLASMGRTPYFNFLDLRRMGIPVETLELTRAVIHQSLVRKLTPGRAGIGDHKESKYQGRVLVSDVHTFDSSHTVEQFVASVANSGDHFIADLTSKLEDGVTDIDEIERCFGNVVSDLLRRSMAQWYPSAIRVDARD